MAIADKRQRDVAREKANRVRKHRAMILGEMAGLPVVESRERAAMLIEDPPEVLHSMSLVSFLCRVRRISEDSASAASRLLAVREPVALGAMTPFERDRMAGALRTAGIGNLRPVVREQRLALLRGRPDLQAWR
jgi:hypothetical protein